ncbi:MAG: N-acetyl-gamma-glutamyl-phosphate reductase [Eggerthella lenta]
MAITTGIVGAAGFAGIELTRLALRHPTLDLRVVSPTSWRHARGRGILASPVPPISPSPRTTTQRSTRATSCSWPCRTPRRSRWRRNSSRARDGGRPVGRLPAEDPAVYERWYATPHTATDLLQRAAFGLPELFPDDLARVAAAHAAGEGVLVACAGCYPTATSLAAAPAVRAGLVRPDAVVVVDAISGVTGAGKKASARTHFCFADENLEAYGVATHRHTPRSRRSGLEAACSTPHAPLNRGLLSTVNLPLATRPPTREDR